MLHLLIQIRPLTPLNETGCIYLFRYGSIALAAAEPDGLAVLGIFFQIQKERNPIYQSLFEGVNYVNQPKDQEFQQVTINFYGD